MARLTALRTDDDVAKLAQLVIEYDPHPQYGGIDWAQVDRTGSPVGSRDSPTKPSTTTPLARLLQNPILDQ